MRKKDTKTPKYLRKSLDLLNQALQIEYSMIFHYPRLAGFIEDEEIRKLVLQLGHVSMNHADVVASAIRELGGEPDWSFEFAPQEGDLVKVFQVQLEKEKLALELHQQSSDSVRDSILRERFRNLAKDEVNHIRTVEDILTRLTEPRASS